jgi:hypothetical protein
VKLQRRRRVQSARQLRIIGTRHPCHLSSTPSQQNPPKLIQTTTIHTQFFAFVAYCDNATIEPNLPIAFAAHHQPLHITKRMMIGSKALGEQEFRVSQAHFADDAPPLP